MRSLVWFRRDLRLDDHPALAAAAARGPVLGLFVVDPRLAAGTGPTRGWYLSEALGALEASCGGHLVVRTGDPRAVVVDVAREVGADAVYVTGEPSPTGRRRDGEVASRLAAAGVAWRDVGTPYGVAPGVVRQPDGRPYAVFSAYARAWARHGVDDVTARPDVTWLRARSEGAGALRAQVARRRPAYFGDLPDGPAPARPAAGEEAAQRDLAAFVARVASYADGRDEPGRDATSRLSPHLRVGALHPRTVLAALDGAGLAADAFRRQLVWREFYADVLWHHPASAWRALRAPMASLPVDRGPAAEARFRHWARGETGFALVDAGMRQLLAEGWMHNRARMVCASLLVKHLHLDWRWGARWFLWSLVDGDVASNQHGWQWVAGTGTDAAPYHRIFNPERQAARFDATGAYARRYGAAPEGGSSARVAPLVDLATERAEALARFAQVRSASRGRVP